MNKISEAESQIREDIPKDTPDIAETDTVISVHSPELDTLAVQDASGVVLHLYSAIELTRAFRSITLLTPLQKRILEMRYLSVIIEYEKRLKYIDILHHFTRTTVSLGSVVVPALLSIQSPTAGAISLPLYWSTWIISIMVTICHNFNSVFRFDKKFLGLHTTLEKLKSEGWQYLELSGRYSGHHGHVPPTHLNQYVYFVNAVERIKLKQVEEEFTTLGESEKPQEQTKITQVKPLSEQAVPSPLDLTGNRGKK